MVVYFAGWNMPGYLPEAEPIPCETLEEARTALKDELLYYASEVADDPFDLFMACNDVDALLPGGSVAAEGTAYWIAAEHVSHERFEELFLD